jgi:hypothetical protein
MDLLSRYWWIILLAVVMTATAILRFRRARK